MVAVGSICARYGNGCRRGWRSGDINIDALSHINQSDHENFIVDTSDRGYNFKGEDYGTNPIGIAIIYWEIPPIPHFGAVYALAKTWGMHVEHILEFQIGMRHPKAEAVSEWMLEGQNLRREFGQRKKRSKS